MRDNSAKAAADDEDGCKKISYNCSTHYSHTCFAILVNEIIKEITSQYDEYCGHSELQTQNRVDFLDEADSDIAVTELI
jgi:predicted choloylglycine hydrolase